MRAQPSRSVVMVSYYFPPLIGAASVRAQGIVRYLPECGWRPVIVAPVEGHFHRSGEPEDDPIPPDVRVVRTSNPELSRLLRRAYPGPSPSTGETIETEGAGSGGEEVRPIATGRLGRGLRRAVHELLYLPDAQTGWIPFAASAARQEVERARGRCVLFSSSVPYSAHFAAWWAKRQTGAPWVVEFRDPWSHDHPYGSPRTAARKQLDSRMERSVLLAADHVVVTSETTRQLLLRDTPGLPADRISVVMNGFEPMDLHDPPRPEARVRLVYGGTLYSVDHARPVLQALLQVPESSRPRLVVCGPPERWIEAASDVPGAADVLSLQGVVSPQRVRAELSRGSALVILNPEPEASIVLPGKLFEYLGARRPILAGVPVGSEMEALIHAYGRLVPMRPFDASGASSALADLIRWHREGRLQAPTALPSELEPLERRSQVHRLAEIFDRVTYRSGEKPT